MMRLAPRCFWQVLAMTLVATLAAASFAGTQEGTDIQPVAVKTLAADPPRLETGDEIDQMAAKLKPAARFAGYRPQWKVETRTFSFAHYNRSETSTYRVVLDGEKVVAVLRSGDIMLVARTPETARTKVNMPTERLHLDNLLGPSLPTWQFIKNVKTHGSIYTDLGDKVLPQESWEKGPASLTFVRKQNLPEYSVEARFVFTVDPVFGYRIDAVRDVDFAKKPEKKEAEFGAGSFCPGCYVPWEHAAIYNRTAWTPKNGGIEGWANNLLCMDRCDEIDRKNFAWRDGGFITYMPAKDAWSPAFTRKDGTGDTPSLAVCNAHNDFHIKFIMKDLPEKNGKFHLHAVHRLLALPPELTAQVWGDMKMIQQNAKGIIIKLGKAEDFENQPVPLTEPARGMVWTSGEPKLVEGIAHSGSKSLLIKGRAWPNLPQISLKPGAKYRLEGWYKVVPWTKEQRAEAKAKDETHRKELAAKGKPLPDAIDWDHVEGKAYIRGDYYEWSPYDGPILQINKTSAATDKTDQWQHVVWDFTAPEWGPFINIAFHADYCEAYLDDFALREVTETAGK